MVHYRGASSRLGGTPRGGTNNKGGRLLISRPMFRFARQPRQRTVRSNLAPSTRACDQRRVSIPTGDAPLCIMYMQKLTGASKLLTWDVPDKRLAPFAFDRERQPSSLTLPIGPVLNRQSGAARYAVRSMTAKCRRDHHPLKGSSLWVRAPISARDMFPRSRTVRKTR